MALNWRLCKFCKHVQFPTTGNSGQMLDCAKSELMALAESKTPIQSLKDDLKPGGKLELLELCLKEGTENRFTLNNYTTALVENVNKRFPDVSAYGTGII